MLRHLLLTACICSFGFAQGKTMQDIREQLMTPKQLQVYKEKKELLAKSQKKVFTIFYLTSSSMGAKAASSFSNSLQKLIDKKVQVQGFVVLNGFPDNFKTYLQDAIKEAKNTDAIIKIHPLIFREFKLKRVPAYALGYCHEGENFAFKECEIKYLIKGDMALSDVFRRIGDIDKSYTDYYFKMIDPN